MQTWRCKHGAWRAPNAFISLAQPKVNDPPNHRLQKQPTSPAQLASLSQLSQLRLQPQTTYDPEKTSLRSLDLPSPSNMRPSRCGAKLYGVPIVAILASVWMYWASRLHLQSSQQLGTEQRLFERLFVQRAWNTKLGVPLCSNVTN